MNPSIKEALAKMTTDQLTEVLDIVTDLIEMNKEGKEMEDDGQPSEQTEQADFAKDDMIPYDEE
jgi:hypothetical protein